MGESTLEADRDSLLACAKASPVAAGNHDKSLWVSLFADQAVVEDPVGTPPCRKGMREGRSGCELGRFYDTFIEPSTLSFMEHRDIVGNDWVLRDVTIHTSNLKTKTDLAVPAILLYEIKNEAGNLKISRMAAHWEMKGMGKQLAKFGARGRRTMLHMNWRMLRHQGVRWTLGYLSSLRKRVGRPQKGLVMSCLTAKFDAATAITHVCSETKVNTSHGHTTTLIEWLLAHPIEAIHQILVSGLTIAVTAAYRVSNDLKDVGLIFHFDDERMLRSVQTFET